jgi:signal transduction histidine kinase
VLDIEDHGTGIPEEIWDWIFDPDFSTKNKGTQKGMCLGLTTAYSILTSYHPPEGGGIP